MQYIAFDSHKHFTFASVEDHASRQVYDQRINHERGALKAFLANCEPNSPVAIETIGNWYWIVDEIEEAGMIPRLVHARKAKMMLASSKKTDKLDAHGMNRLQRTGTLPTVWIPDSKLRDTRELFRTRMFLSHQRTRLKNRIHSTLDKYGIKVENTSDIFNVKGRDSIQASLTKLPQHTRFAIIQLLKELDFIQDKILKFQYRMSEVFSDNPQVKLLRTIPGIGPILSIVIYSEIGDINRFPSSSNLAAYSGTTPSIHASGGKYRYGRAPKDTNRYLKWAFAEAANTVMQTRRRLRFQHIAKLYERVRKRKGHSVAIGAVSRHLAEASFWVLKKAEPYREPVKNNKAISSINK
ncbi:MAG: IS110 family transposase [Spirochaetales bacterium]|nr:IS110 family transposase [Spirochaetales bacterium]